MINSKDTAAKILKAGDLINKLKFIKKIADFNMHSLEESLFQF